MRKLLALPILILITACNSSAQEMMQPGHFQRTLEDVFQTVGELISDDNPIIFHNPDDITHIRYWDLHIRWDLDDEIIPHNSDWDERFGADPFVGAGLGDRDRFAIFGINPDQVASPGAAGITGAGVNPNEAMLGGSAPITREGYIWPVSGSGAIQINRFVGIVSGGFNPSLTINAPMRNVYAMADGEILFAGSIADLDGWDDVFSGSYAMIIQFDPVTLPPLRDRREAPPELEYEDYFIIPFNNPNENNSTVRHTAMFFGIYNISNLPEIGFHDDIPSTASWADIGANTRLQAGDRIRQAQPIAVTARHNGILGVVVLEGAASVSSFARDNLTSYIVLCMLRHMFNHVDQHQASFGIQGRAIIPSNPDLSGLTANQRRFNQNNFASVEFY